MEQGNDTTAKTFCMSPETELLLKTRHYMKEAETSYRQALEKMFGTEAQGHFTEEIEDAFIEIERQLQVDLARSISWHYEAGDGQL